MRAAERIVIIGGVLGTASNPQIQLSNATIPDTTTSGSTVGTLSVAGGTGTFGFASNPGSLFSITGSTLKTASILTAGSYPITISFTGTPTVVNKPFLITVTSTAAVALKADFSNANANEAWVFQ